MEQAIPEPSPESGWNALIESFMDSWLGEGVTTASTVAGTVGNPIISQALCYKTYIDVKYRNMTLEESLQETEEFAKGYVQSVPNVVGENVKTMHLTSKRTFASIQKCVFIIESF